MHDARHTPTDVRRILRTQQLASASASSLKVAAAGEARHDAIVLRPGRRYSKTNHVCLLSASLDAALLQGKISYSDSDASRCSSLRGIALRAETRAFVAETLRFPRWDSANTLWRMPFRAGSDPGRGRRTEADQARTVAPTKHGSKMQRTSTPPNAESDLPHPERSCV
ncbi:hypothetical protein PYCCODRAFT_620830 [Trametes coccinea BRFM310]|uniref:Uncharacterized protein n=1 Tax=Trametes coccinea (strain BRFM310) TaxID=1353009 RepID=A0A1Y2J3Z0_TRAC3|nr:hypothetical protein PYCCODRAFT_620830 [Trametes coccinea BRFM310]